jgi:hypothetical protein
MKTKLTIAAATAALAGIATAGAGATATAPVHVTKAAAVRHAEGRVTTVNRSAPTFTVRDAERGTLTVTVTRTTKFEGVTFASLRTGKVVDVRAQRVAGVWNATKVESGNKAENNHDLGDDHGGDRHRGGNDDGAGHH